MKRPVEERLDRLIVKVQRVPAWRCYHEVDLIYGPGAAYICGEFDGNVNMLMSTEGDLDALERAVDALLDIPTEERGALRSFVARAVKLRDQPRSDSLLEEVTALRSFVEEVALYAEAIPKAKKAQQAKLRMIKGGK